MKKKPGSCRPQRSSLCSTGRPLCAGSVPARCETGLIALCPFRSDLPSRLLPPISHLFVLREAGFCGHIFSSRGRDHNRSVVYSFLILVLFIGANVVYVAFLAFLVARAAFVRSQRHQESTWESRILATRNSQSSDGSAVKVQPKQG